MKRKTKFIVMAVICAAVIKSKTDRIITTVFFIFYLFLSSAKAA